MSVKVFIDAIIWPNLAGETPCTREYAEAVAAQKEITEKYQDNQGHYNLDDFEVADYDAYFVAQSKVDDLALDGHLGQGFRYA